MADALYLYGLAPREHYAKLDALDADIELLEHAGLAAVYRRCLQREFAHSESDAGQGHLNRRLLSQIGEHDNIVQSIIAITPFFPARFATLYSSKEVLLSFMRSNHSAIENFLSSSAGHREWAVKGYIKREQACDYLLAEALRQQPPKSECPGQRYVQKRQTALKVERQITQWLQARAEEVIERLSQLTADIVKRPLPAPIDSDTTEECFGNWALLLADDRIDSLQQALDDINAREAPHGLRFGCTGPWALYSFSQKIMLKN